jgi:hypothetical protein
MYGIKESGSFIDLTLRAGIGSWFIMLYNEKEAKYMEPDFAQFVCLHS